MAESWMTAAQAEHLPTARVIEEYLKFLFATPPEGVNEDDFYESQVDEYLAWQQLLRLRDPRAAKRLGADGDDLAWTDTVTDASDTTPFEYGLMGLLLDGDRRNHPPVD